MRPDISISNLMSLFLAWEAAEVSEGRMVELTGLDRVVLRGLKQEAIEEGKRIAHPTDAEVRTFASQLGLSPSHADSAVSAMKDRQNS